jgi:hypothetical protein
MTHTVTIDLSDPLEADFANRPEHIKRGYHLRGLACHDAMIGFTTLQSSELEARLEAAEFAVRAFRELEAYCEKHSFAGFWITWGESFVLIRTIRDELLNERMVN